MKELFGGKIKLSYHKLYFRYCINNINENNSDTHE